MEQEVSWFWKVAPYPLPAPPLQGPLGSGPVGMAAAPNVSQEWPLPQELSTLLPCPEPEFGAKTKVAEAPPNPSLLLLCAAGRGA